MTRLAFTAIAGLLVATSIRAQEKKADTLTITVSGGKHDLRNVPVTVALSVPKSAAEATTFQVTRKDERGFLETQVSAPGLITESVPPADKSLVRRDLHFLLPELNAGETVTLSCVLGQPAHFRNPTYFYWQKSTKEHTDLEWIELDIRRRPVLRYMHRPYDDSTPENRNLSYKVFHHLYDPAGKRLVTNGGHTNEGVTDPKKLLYPHHRGLQMGWNKCTYGGGKKADTWHCQKDDHQSHEGIVRAEAGPIFGRHRILVDWHGPGKETFAKEERELTAYALPGGTLIEFAARVKTTGGKVKLDGDPQHAGFQFRAHNDVAAKTAKE